MLVTIRDNQQPRFLGFGLVVFSARHHRPTSEKSAKGSEALLAVQNLWSLTREAVLPKTPFMISRPSF